MNKFYPIIILSKNKIENLEKNYLQISLPINLINNITIIFENCEYSFDYLIFDDINLINNYFETNILHDNNIPVTNFFNATSIDNIFYSKNIINTIYNIENEEF